MFSRIIYSRYLARSSLDIGKTRNTFAFVDLAVVEFQVLGPLILGIPNGDFHPLNEYTLLLARDFSSSRRAPPNAASKFVFLFKACFTQLSSLYRYVLHLPLAIGADTLIIFAFLVWNERRS